MTSLKSGKDDKADCLGLIFNVLYQHFSDRPRLATKIYQGSWTLDWDQNSDPPKYTSGIPNAGTYLPRYKALHSRSAYYLQSLQ
jgi:hypothetical protein